MVKSGKGSLAFPFFEAHFSWNKWHISLCLLLPSTTIADWCVGSFWNLFFSVSGIFMCEHYSTFYRPGVYTTVSSAYCVTTTFFITMPCSQETFEKEKENVDFRVRVDQDLIQHCYEHQCEILNTHRERINLVLRGSVGVGIIIGRTFSAVWYLQ